MTNVQHATTSNGMGTVAAPVRFSAEYRLPSTGASATAQVAAALTVLAGLWVATSPWFLVLQHGGSNATVSDLVVGLAVAAIGLFAISGARGFMGLQLATLAAGGWLIISPFILSAHLAIATPMYWSNIWAGGAVMALSVAALAALGLRRPAR